MKNKIKYILPTVDGNQIDIYGTEDHFEIDGISFEKIDAIIHVDHAKEISKEKLDKYASKGLVKSLCEEFTVADINNNLTFCEFKLKNDKVKNIAGVYLWVLNNEIIYIGETERLKDRFNTGYGTISPRNLFKGGQSTNCKMNRVVLNNTKLNKCIIIYFCNTLEHKELEKKLLSKYKPKYNARK